MTSSSSRWSPRNWHTMLPRFNFSSQGLRQARLRNSGTGLITKDVKDVRSRWSPRNWQVMGPRFNFFSQGSGQARLRNSGTGLITKDVKDVRSLMHSKIWSCLNPQNFGTMSHPMKSGLEPYSKSNLGRSHNPGPIRISWRIRSTTLFLVELG
jgi:hypothetical protein